MKWFALFTLASLVFSPIASSAAFEDEVFDPNQLLSDEEFLDAHAMTKSEIDQFLKRGSLAQYIAEDVYGNRVAAGQLIWNVSQQFEINPKFLLVLLQREQSLVEDDTPTQNQLDWAMGYAVCDDCSKSDPRIQKFKGFGKQVYYAAERIRENYLVDLQRHGKTQSGVGPGLVSVIDGTPVIPQNFVTSALYTYTPHLHGNKNFVNIWNRWFTRDYLTGSLLQDSTTGNVWLIQSGTRRPIASRAALYSRFQERRMVKVASSEIERYPLGTPIAFPNYSLLRSPRGTVYLLVDDTKRGFTSQEAFRALGYSPDEITDVGWEELNQFTDGEPISTDAVYPQGALLQNKVNGGIFFVENGKKHPIMSKQLLAAHTIPSAIVAVTQADLDAYPTADPLTFPDGSLIAVVGSPDVFVVADGLRHPIADEATFLSYGWNWDQIIWTNERSVLLHPLGDTLSTSAEQLTDVTVATTL